MHNCGGSDRSFTAEEYQHAKWISCLDIRCSSAVGKQESRSDRSSWATGSAADAATLV